MHLVILKGNILSPREMTCGFFCNSVYLNIEGSEDAQSDLSVSLRNMFTFVYSKKIFVKKIGSDLCRVPLHFIVPPKKMNYFYCS